MAARRPGWLTTAIKLANRLDLYNFGRWLVLAMMIGVVAGLGAAMLTWGVDGLGALVHTHLVGFQSPGHGSHGTSDWHAPTRSWMLLIVLPVAGLLVGWLVQTFAPEAEGHGTDAVIDSYHNRRAVIRTRVVPIKLLASVLTIGSGGSAGREGPVAQVGAGFASFLAQLLHLPVRDRRVLVVAGVAAGIGGMFRAPLGGALFAIEVLYSENEHESEPLIPAIIASIISYVVCASLTTWGAIFEAEVRTFTNPLELVSYLVLGMILALVGIVYVKVFYGVRDSLFARLAVPEWIKPGIGGLMLAVVAMFLPQVMGGGYGWLQLTIDEQLPLKLLLMLLPAKILATALTISSGGSGGVFAPSLVIGGITGAIFANLVSQVWPAGAPAATACVLVGMGGFFAGVAKVPIASLIMVAEMSGSYSLLVPMMLVSSVAVLLTRGVSIYSAQVPLRIDSPAHLGELEIDILERLTVQQVLEPARSWETVRPGTGFEEIIDLVSSTDQEFFPIVNEQGLVEGMFSLNDVRRVMATPEVWPLLVASDLGVGVRTMAFLEPDVDLHTAVQHLTVSRLETLPVLAGPPPSPVIGFLGLRRVMEAYDTEVRRLREAELEDD
jgi:CIC family chloride channel protein